MSDRTRPLTPAPTSERPATNELAEVIAAAARSTPSDRMREHTSPPQAPPPAPTAQATPGTFPGRGPVTLLAAPGRLPPRLPAGQPTSAVPAPADAPARTPAATKLGPLWLRLGFYLSGFHDALQERQGRGEPLTDRETTLMELTRREFSDMRPLVIAMAVQRLQSVVNAESPEGPASPARDTMEGFAHATLRDLSRRACAMLDQDGPEAAFALLCGTPSTVEPLAIFQTVFDTALGIAESFTGIIGAGAGSLQRTMRALEAALEAV